MCTSNNMTTLEVDSKLSELDDPIEFTSLQPSDVIGKEFASIEDAEAFYNNYSMFIGFSIGKDEKRHDIQGTMDFFEQHAYDEENEAIHRLDMKLNALVQQYGEWKSMIFAREQTQAMNSYNLWPVHEPFEHSYNPWPSNEPYGNSHSQWSSYEPYDNTYNPDWRNNQDFSWSHNEVNTYEQPVSPAIEDMLQQMQQQM
ncbi:hypothetical protein LWI29_000096 [Acer saccharum]|uniref:Uncharacterized protein n=1 Tax=Acer saccharum TaxID=4024 RepID=A0AA39RNM0_ACESA|nr:hypothetical protein LWI29_000096 [Acer saccharum]